MSLKKAIMLPFITLFISACIPTEESPSNSSSNNNGPYLSCTASGSVNNCWNHKYGGFTSSSEALAWCEQNVRTLVSFLPSLPIGYSVSISVSKSYCPDSSPVPELTAVNSVSNANKNQDYTSNEIRARYLVGTTELAIDNGLLIVNGVEQSGKTAQISSDDRFQIRLTSSSQFGTTVKSTISISSIESEYRVTTEQEDIEADAFSLTQILEATPSTYYESNTITINGINSAVTASIDNGLLIINDVPQAEKTAAVLEGDLVQVKLLSSDALASEVLSTLSIGNISAEFKVQTLQTYFSDIEIADINTFYTSNSYRAEQDNLTVSIDNGTLIINGVESVDQSGVLNTGDEFTVKLLSGSALSEVSNSNITIGSFVDQFSLTVKPSNYEFISNNTYSNLNETYNYLTIQQAGNIDFTLNYSNSEAYIYDSDMNLLNQIRNYNAVVSLDAGSYIVKIVNKSSSGSVGVYSPVLDQLNNFPQLQNGTYSEYLATFYYLTMASADNVDFTLNYSNSEAYIYDSDMNLLSQVKNYNGVVSLEGGSYIVKIINKSNAGSIGVYSPVLDQLNNFPQLQNGTYSEYLATFYYLTMASAGNVDFTLNYSNSEAYIYDSDMNLLSQVKNYNGVVSLEAGSYIVKIINKSNVGSVSVGIF